VGVLPTLLRKAEFGAAKFGGSRYDNAKPLMRILPVLAYFKLFMRVDEWQF